MSVIAIFLIIAVVGGLGFFYSKQKALKKARMPLQLDTLSAYEEPLYSIFMTIAIEISKDDFMLIGRPIYKNDGSYRAAFIEAVKRQKTKIIDQVCRDGKVSFSFVNYVKQKQDVVCAQDLKNLIRNYLQDASAKPITFTPEPTSPHISTINIPHLKANGEVTGTSSNSLFVIDDDDEDEPGMTPQEFFALRNESNGDAVGVYIIHNVTQDKYYVGQAKRVMFRVNQHLTGHGNGDVYADMKMGNEFRIQIVRLVDSGYSDLDKLERDLIAQYHAYDTGYNRTKGNT